MVAEKDSPGGTCCLYDNVLGNRHIGSHVAYYFTKKRNCEVGK